MDKKRILIYIVSYQSENMISNSLNLVPVAFLQKKEYQVEILILTNKAENRALTGSKAYLEVKQICPITILSNISNQGYGENQKIAYHYAIQKKFDIVVWVHSKGRYSEEYFEQIIQPIIADKADVVHGSERLYKFDRLARNNIIKGLGGERLIKNARAQLQQTKLSGFFTVYRAYRVATLSDLPFAYNSDGAGFDTELFVQLLDTKKRILKIPISIIDCSKLSRINYLKYCGFRILSDIQKWGILYHPRFDYYSGNTIYKPKFGYASSHQFSLERVKPGSQVLDLGCGPGFMSRELRKKGVVTISVDREITAIAKETSLKTIQADLETFNFYDVKEKIDTILALDIIEHLKAPERFLQRLREHFCHDNPEIILTTGNIAFLLTRLGLMFGQFNYGRKGILDLDHARLFTFYSLERLLRQQGFEIVESKGLPAPFILALGDNTLGRFVMIINSWLIKVSKNIFSYQLAIVAKPKPTLNMLLDQAMDKEEQI